MGADDHEALIDAGPGHVSDHPIDPADVQASFDRLSDILVGMMDTVAELSTHRCPYRDRVDRCTASFGCRNQRIDPDGSPQRICGGDERLDYRSAWQSE